jgi:hypothetical protein
VEKFSPLRQEAARQILNIYRFETHQRNNFRPKSDFSYDRNGHEYFEMMNGLTATLGYAENLPDSNTILDLGTGTGRGCVDLAKQFENLNFIGTGLRRYPETERFLPGNKFTLTSGENLRGIKDKSIAGVIANFSITYSHAQQLVAERVDEILVPGGIVKATFVFSPEKQPNLILNKRARITLDRTKPKDYKEFEKALLTMGYDVEVKPVLYPDKINVRRYILLAIKPENPSSFNAKEILAKDLKLMPLKENIRRWARLFV